MKKNYLKSWLFKILIACPKITDGCSLAEMKKIQVCWWIWECRKTKFFVFGKNTLNTWDRAKWILFVCVFLLITEFLRALLTGIMHNIHLLIIIGQILNVTSCLSIYQKLFCILVSRFLIMPAYILFPLCSFPLILHVIFSDSSYHFSIFHKTFNFFSLKFFFFGCAVQFAGS